MTSDQNQVKLGLDGILAFESSIATIDGDVPELIIRGYDIKEIASTLSFEEMTYLLLYSNLPTGDILTSFTKELASLRSIPSSILQLLSATPKEAHPMAVLRTAVSLIGVSDPNADNLTSEDNFRKAINLTAKMPTIVAAQSRIQSGKAPISPDPKLGHSENYLYMLTGENPNPVDLKAFETTLVLYAEHETNASTFACRVVVGTLSDFYSSVVAGIGAIKGPLHGGAIDDAMRMFMDIGSPDQAKTYVETALSNKQKLSGFGHRVYRAGDPRAAELKDLARDMSASHGDSQWYDIAQEAELAMKNTKNIIPNVDYYAAIVLYQLGFQLNMMTNVVASTRIAGWSAHILEQYNNNRLIRPRALYTGERGKKHRSERP
jgi:citrate synthase